MVPVGWKDMEVRPVRPKEYAAAGEVTAEAYREYARPDGGWDEYLLELADVAGRVGRTEVFVALEDGRVLGCVTLELDQALGDDDKELPPGLSCIRMLGVDREARGNGVGRALVQRCIDRSREAGKATVTLRTTRPMKAARHLYESMGFERDPARDMVYDSGFRLLAFRLELRATGSG
jgi:ribosomal protein S18 acetylase RimI-like enzyme